MATSVDLLAILEDLNDADFKKFKWFLQQSSVLEGFAAIPRSQLQNSDRLDVLDQILDTYNKDTVHVMVTILKEMKKHDLERRLVSINSVSKENLNDCQLKLKSRIRKKCQFSVEVDVQSATCMRINEVFTEPHLVKKTDEDAEKHSEPTKPVQSNIVMQPPPMTGIHHAMVPHQPFVHGVQRYHYGFQGFGDPFRQFPTPSYRMVCGATNTGQQVNQTPSTSQKETSPKHSFNIEDLFKAVCGHEKSVRTVLTNGPAGVGKTLLMKKFSLDWADNKVGNEIQFVFPITFRELNLLKVKRFSWIKLLHHLFPELKEAGVCSFGGLPVIFALDGLDEFQLPLEFHHSVVVTEVTEAAEVDILLTNLITGKVFPDASVWMTTTPETAGWIPDEYVHLVTELRGFTDPSKKEYLQRIFRNKELVRKAISHMSSSHTLSFLCRTPVYCWITAVVLKDIIQDDLPVTLTELYIKFLQVQLLSCAKESNIKIILLAAKLAFEQLHSGNFVFSEEDLDKSGVDVGSLAAVKIFTQIHNEDLSFGKLFCFVHSTVQEFFAALHVIVTYFNSGVNLLCDEKSLCDGEKMAPVSERSFSHSVLEKALEYPNKYLKLFLCFFTGLLSQGDQFVQVLLDQPATNPCDKQGMELLFREKIRGTLSPNRCISLLLCLNELHNSSAIEETQEYLNSVRFSPKSLTPAQWFALISVLLTSPNLPDCFELKKFLASEQGLLKFLPVVQVSTVTLLNSCKLSRRSLYALAPLLRASSTRLIELDLSYNDIDSGIQVLSEALKDPHCRLETLRLSHCKLSSTHCEDLSAVLGCQFSRLKEIDLSNNSLKDKGIAILSKGLTSTNCRLKVLRLNNCALTWKACDSVALFLGFSYTSLEILDLSMNKLEDSGVVGICVGLESPYCKLETMSLRFCNLTETCCKAIALVLVCQTSSLKELILSNNDLQDTGLMALSGGLDNPQSHLEALRLNGCLLTERSCEALAAAFMSHNVKLRELDLSSNDLQDYGVKLLADGLQSPECRLESLRMSGCLISTEGCTCLARTLSNTQLRDLDLSYNHPGDSGLALLSDRLHDQNCSLEKLNVDHCGSQRMKAGLYKYFCDLELDPNTAQRELLLSRNNREVTYEEKEQPYPFHIERFDYFNQIMCVNSLSGRNYWEVETKGSFFLAMAYRDMCRKGEGNACMFGGDDKSWALYNLSTGTSVYHNNIETEICVSNEDLRRVGVYLDWPGGTLSFFNISSKVTHLYTFSSRFTQPLHPGFGFRIHFGGFSSVRYGSSVLLGPSDQDTS